ncbi:hypothetical protein SAMD00019534_029630, partial [Acytostelium subglobosum LB1]|uniref:hypothetical protein n=1 Tax=Acytostelium subglobosum LB1 TaxID=1410327 RepID=UPI000645236D
IKHIIMYRTVILVLLMMCIYNVDVSTGTHYRRNRNDYDHYVGAVLEYAPVNYNFTGGDPSANAITYMTLNLDIYQLYAQEAATAGAQIIIFPEYGILGVNFDTRDTVYPYLENIPDPTQSLFPIIPCGDSDFDDRVVLQTLSCMAIKNKIYVVADMGDVQPCTNETTPDCPSDGRFQYNTLVSFSAGGQLLARYHKTHLFGESSYFDAAAPEAITFETSFGVTFGMMICFDIMYEQPQTMLLEKGIKHLSYASAWDNGNYLYARQMQQSWSYLNSANLLAANIGENFFTSGSGLYTSGNVLASTVNPTMVPGTKLLIARLPVDPVPANEHRRRHTPMPLGDLPPQGLNGSTVVPFTPEPTEQGVVVASNNGLECTLSYQMSEQPTGELFALISYNQEFADYFNLQICYLTKCLNNTLEGCQYMVFDSETMFSSVTISGNFDLTRYHLNPTVNTIPMGNFLDGYTNGTNYFTAQQINAPLISMSLMGIQWI